jgi:hypothetical protein
MPSGGEVSTVVGKLLAQPAEWGSSYVAGDLWGWGLLRFRPWLAE